MNIHDHWKRVTRFHPLWVLIKANEKHKHETRFSSSGNFYINTSRLNQNQGYFASLGAKLWNSIRDELRQLPKRAFKKHNNNMLLSILEAPILRIVWKLVERTWNHKQESSFLVGHYSW